MGDVAADRVRDAALTLKRQLAKTTELMRAQMGGSRPPIGERVVAVSVLRDNCEEWLTAIGLWADSRSGGGLIDLETSSRKPEGS